MLCTGKICTLGYEYAAELGKKRTSAGQSFWTHRQVQNLTLNEMTERDEGKMSFGWVSFPLGFVSFPLILKRNEIRYNGVV